MWSARSSTGTSRSSSVPLFRSPQDDSTQSSSGSSSRRETPTPLCGAPLATTSFQTPLAGFQRRAPSQMPSSTVSSTTTATSRSGPTTPSSSYSGHRIEALDSNSVLAVVEGRGQARGEIGIACMNMHTPNLILSQFTDTQSFLKVVSKVNIFRPQEILMTAASCDPSSRSQLCQQLQKEIPNVRIIPIQRRVFSETKGLQKLNTLVADEYMPVVHSITSKYYCLAAAAALLKYVELVSSLVFASHSLRLEFQGCDKACMIDHVTAQHLELLVNNHNPNSGHSLFGILNDCKTPLGARLLRMSILQPPCDEALTKTRLNSVEELMSNREMLYGIQDVLGRMPIDIEHVIAALIQIPKISNVKTTEYRINYIIALKHTLELLPSLAKVLEDTEDRCFQTLRNNLTSPQFDTILEKIKEVINDEAQFQKGPVHMKHQRCFAVKADINPILDVARKAYCDIIEDINNYVVELSQSVNMSLRLNKNNQRGFYIQYFTSAKTSGVPRLPPQFLQVRRRGNMVTFTTEMLISGDHRAQEVQKEIENLSGIVIAELIVSLRGDIGAIFKVSEAIGYLDLVYSLAKYALVTPRCVRPIFSKDITSISMGRHPIIESISAEPAVPNTVCVSNYSNFMVITGPNMSGKTTFIKQTALLQVLAQIGSFVPAESATFRVASNILSRVGTGDSISENSSSFQLELSEMTYILQNVNKNSLVIIDELGRATSIEEGAAVCWTMAEELLRTQAFVLFATHHLFLAKLETLYLNCTNYRMVTQEWKNEAEPRENSSSISTLPSSRLHYNHVLERGVTDVELYGLKFAMNTSYPQRIIEKCIPIVNAVMEERGLQGSPKAGEVDAEEKRKTYLLGSQLAHLANTIRMGDDDNVDGDSLRQYLQKVQQDFKAALRVQPAAAFKTEGDERSQDQEEEGAPGLNVT